MSLQPNFERELATNADHKTQIQSALRQARIHGSQQVLKSLLCRETWNATAAPLQDLVFAEIDRRLSQSYIFVGTQRYECGTQRHRIGLFKHTESGAVMSLLPGGQYARGSNDDLPNQTPVRLVTIQPFLISQTSITEEQWNRITSTKVSEQTPGNLPVSASWGDCKRWLRTTGGGLRLPTEAEWEYAARAGSTGHYFFGDEQNQLNDYCWYALNAGWDSRRPVGQLLPNSFGLFDVYGNVAEWCEDDFTADYQRHSTDGRAFKSASDEGRRHKVVRGGSCGTGPKNTSSTRRHFGIIDDESVRYGLRVVKTVPVGLWDSGNQTSL